jgi:outer membrane biosynthesis protein TonB
MSRTEKWALGGAAIGHALLFVGLSLIWKSDKPADLKLSPPIDVSLVDEVALESTAPADTEAPADSVAPDQGAPEDAAPPEETAPEPEPEPAPAPPVPQPKPEPRPEPKPAPKPQPAPKPVPKPQPPKPKPAPKPAPKAPEKPAPKPAPKPAAKPAAKPASAKPAAAAAKPKPAAAAKGSGTDEKAKAAKPRGSRLGDDFAKSLAQTAAEKGTGQTARAAKVGAQSLAGLAAAISRQIQPCANRITNPGPGANRIRSRINLQMAKDGSLTARPKLLGQTGVDDENGRYAQRVGELASAAIIQCAPFELPDELYEGGWKNITINYKLPG